MDPACVKCAGKHKNIDCKKSLEESSPKCALCKGSHTANYKGCEIYKALKIQRFPPLRKRVDPQIAPNYLQPTTSNPIISYADTLNSHSPANLTAIWLN